jgi:site-specific recombinase XerD
LNNTVTNILEDLSHEDLATFQNVIESLLTQKVSTGRKYTIDHFAMEYLKYIQNTFSEKYLISIRLTFKHLMAFYGKEKLLSAITVKDAEDFKSQLMISAPKGVELYFRNIKASFNKAIEWDLINNNPFQNIKFKRTQKSKPKFLRRSELDLILSNTTSTKLKEIFIFGFYSGCRLGEIVNLRWQNIDLTRLKILIGDEEFITKSARTRNIPMNNTLLQLLSSKWNLQSKEKFVFSKDSGYRFTKEYVSKYFKNSVRKAGLPEELHFHSLRHSFASNLAIAGIPLVSIKELLGHSSISVTEIYSHTNYESLQQAVKVLE